MEAGYGFGGEGDWKTAALTRVMKLIAGNKGTSFMEDYTYHFEPGREMILGAHMLEICPTIAADRPRLEVHPLGIGGKADPARMIFNGRSGGAVNACLIDLGGPFPLDREHCGCHRRSARHAEPASSARTVEAAAVVE